MIHDLLNVRCFLWFAMIFSVACAKSIEHADSDSSFYERDAMVYQDVGINTESVDSDSGIQSGKDSTIEDSQSGSGDGYSTDIDTSGDAISQPPVREPRPEWEPPFEIAEPGWRASVEPFCPSVYGHAAGYAVWSSDQGVYAVVSRECKGFASGFVPCNFEEKGLELLFNDGSGWQTLFSTEANGGNMELTGFPDNTAVVYGDNVDDLCDVKFITSDSSRCFDSIDSIVRDVFVVNNDLAYAVLLDRILVYSNGEWKASWASDSSDIWDINSIWAIDQTVIVAGYKQTVLISKNGSSLAPLPNVPAGNYGAMWAFAEDNVWLGNTAGQLVHYDGVSWEVIVTGSQDTTGDGIRGLWGEEGKLFFHTDTELGLWNGSEVQWLLSRTPDRIRISDIHGNSANEVFIAIEDKEYAEYNCGGSTFLLWYDGEEFHQM